MARWSRRISSGVERPRRALGMDARLEEGLVDVHVPEAGDQRLVEQHRLDRPAAARQQAREDAGR